MRVEYLSHFVLLELTPPISPASVHCPQLKLRLVDRTAPRPQARRWLEGEKEEEEAAELKIERESQEQVRERMRAGIERERERDRVL